MIDVTGHGTKNASLLLSQGRGWLRGLTPACTLLVGKVIRSGASNANDKILARAIRWAVHEGAQVVILPVGRANSSVPIAREVHRALVEGVLFFAAAGNRGPDTYLFPGRLRGVTAVSAADTNGTPLSWCCQSSGVNCYAPGQEVWAVGPDGPGSASGPSPATVLAGGVAALRIAYERRSGKNRHIEEKVQGK